MLALMGFAALYPSYKSKKIGGAEGPPIASSADRFRQALPLACRALVLEDRAEQFPALAVELHHLQLLVDAVIVRRGVGDDARQRQIELDVLEAGRLLHDVLAGEIVAARLEHVDQQLRGRIAVAVKARILVAIRIVLRHELEI